MFDQQIDDRPVIVCLHGSASDAGMWQELREAVRGRADVVAPDLFAGKDVMQQIEDIRVPFHLVGHGYGGAIAAHIAANNPERVSSMVLYEPTAVDDLPCGRIDVPLRLVSGTRSWESARQNAERLAACFRNSSLLRLFGMRHMAPLTHPRLINAVILDYVLPAVMPGEDGPAWGRAA
jgi:pimeloyl-ACP methyl ester carboxylesterase